MCAFDESDLFLCPSHSIATNTHEENHGGGGGGVVPHDPRITAEYRLSCGRFARPTFFVFPVGLR